MIMHWLEIVLIGIALSMDALAVSLALGAAESRTDGRVKMILLAAFLFGLFQALMPLAGWFGVSLCGDFLQRFGRYIAAGLLGAIGGKMIWDREQEQTDAFGFFKLILLAFATSIDAFLVGISFACLGWTCILPEVLVIGFITFCISAAGGALGRGVRKWLGNYSTPVGGLVLVLIGVKILFFG